MKLNMLRLGAVLAIGLAIAGCPDDGEIGTEFVVGDVADTRDGTDGGDTETDTDSPGDSDGGDDADGGDGTAQVRVLHASPEAPGVDVFANGAGPVVEDLTFLEGTDYLTVDAGQYLFAVTPTGATPEDAVLNANVNLTADTATSVVAFGPLEALQALAIDDDRAGLADGNIRLEVIHTAFGVSTVNILAIDGEEESVLIEDLGYGTTQGTLDVPAGAYSIGLDVDDDQASDLRCEVPALSAGQKVNVYAVLDGEQVRLVAQLDDQVQTVTCTAVAPPTPDPAFVRAIHLSPDAPNVDVWAQGSLAPLLTDLAFRQSSDYAEALPGVYDLSVVPAGLGIENSVFDVNGLGLNEDDRTSVAVYGRAAELSALSFVEALDGLQSGLIRVRAVHTAVDVGTVNLYAVTAAEQSLVWETLDYGEAGSTFDLPAGAYTVGIDVGADTEVDLLCSLPALPAGSIVNVYAVNDLADVQLVVQFNESTTTLPVTCVPPPVDSGAVRVVHLSPNAPTVDTYVDGEGPLAEGLSFLDVTEYLSIPSGDRVLDLVPTDATAFETIFSVLLPVESNNTYTAIAYDVVTALKPIYIEDDLSDPGPGNIRIRPVHAATGVGQVDLYAVFEGGALFPLTSDLDFGAAAPAIIVPSGAYLVGIDLNDDIQVDLTCALPALAPGAVANVYAVADGDAVLLLAHLSDGTAVPVSCEPSTVPPLALLRIVHLSPNAPDVDVYADGDGPLVSLGFLSQVGPAFAVGGEYTFDVTPAGAGLGASVLDFTAELQSGQSYSAIAYGNLPDITPLLLTENNTTPGAGLIRVRPVHVADGVGAVDLYAVLPDGTSLPLAPQLPYGQAGEYAEVPAGQYGIGFDLDGDAEAFELVCNLPALPAGTVANVYAVNTPDGVVLFAQLPGEASAIVGCAAPPTPEQGEVRAIHLLPGGPTVAVTANGQTAFSGLAPLQTTGFASLDAGDYAFSVVPEPNPLDLTIVDFAAAVTPASQSTAVVWGTLDDPSALLLAEDDVVPGAGNLRLRAVHAAAGVGTVDIYVNDTLTLPQFTAGTASVWLEVPAGDYVVGIDADVDGNQDLSCAADGLPAGLVANLFAVAFADGSLNLVAQPKSGDLIFIACEPIVTTEPAELRVLHASPQAPAVDVFADGDLFGQLIPYGTGTAYVDVPADGYVVDVAPAGAGIGASVGTFDVSLEAGVAYTAIAHGLPGDLQLLPVVDDTSEPAEGNIRVRAIHAALDVSTVDIYAILPGGAASVLLAQGLPYATAGTATEVPAGDYDVGFDVDQDGDFELTCDLPALDVGTIASVVAVSNDGEVSLVTQLSNGSEPLISCVPVVDPAEGEIRAIHLSADAPNVDIYADGTGPVFTNLGYTETTAYTTVPAAAITIGIAGASQPPVADPTFVATSLVTVEDNQSVTVVAFDTVGALQTLALVDDRSPTAAGNVRIRAAHLAPGVPPVKVTAITSVGAVVTLYDELSFGTAGEALEVPGGTYDIGLDINATGEADLLCSLPALVSGTVANVFAAPNGASVQLVVQPDAGAAFAVPCVAPPEPPKSSVRVAHLSPNAPAVDVYANGAGPLASGVPFSVATEYFEVDAGAYSFAVSATGTPVNAAVLTFDATLGAEQTYTAVAWDTLASIKPLLLVDDNSAPAAGNIRLRAIHAASGVGNVDIYGLLPGGAQIVLAQGLAPGVATPASELAGGVDLDVGFDIDADGVLDLVCDAPALEAGTIADVFAVASDEGVSLRVLTPLGGTFLTIPCGDADTPTAEVSVVHLSPAAPTVDIAVDGTVAISSLGFGAIAGPVELATGPTVFDVIVPATGAVALSTSASLEEDENYSVVAYGPAGGLDALLLVNDVSPTAVGNIRLRVAHTAAGVGTVDLYTLSAEGIATPLLTSLQYGTAADALEVPAAAYTIGIDATADGVVDLSCSAPPLAAGALYNVFAVATDGGVSLFAATDGLEAALEVPCAPVAAPTAAVRVVHLSPAAPGVDVFANGDGPIVAGLTYTEVTEYTSVDAGEYTFDVTLTGNQTPVLSADVSLGPDTLTTVVAYGDPNSLAGLVLVDTTTPPAAGNARVRVAHTAVGVGTVNVSAELGPVVVPLATQLAFGEVTDAAEVPAAAYNALIDADLDGTPDLTCSLPALPVGASADVFAVNDGEVSLLVLLDTQVTIPVACTAVQPPATAEVRVVHLSPDAPAVDVFANGAGPVVSGLGFKEVSELLEVPAGDYDFEVTPADTPATVVLEASTTLAADTRTTVVAFDSLAQIDGLILAEPATAPDAGNIQIRAIHTAVGVGTVDISASAGLGEVAELFNGLAFGTASEVLQVPAAAYTVFIDADLDGTDDLTCPLPELPPGVSANLFATNADSVVSLFALLNNGTTVDAVCAPVTTGPQADVRVVHLSPDAPAVDVFANGGEPAISGLTFLSGAGPLAVDAGTYTFDVAPTGAGIDASVLTAAGLSLEANASYTVVAYDTLDSIDALFLEDSTQDLGTNVRVRFVHTAAGVGPVDLYAQPNPQSNVLISNDLGFGVAGPFLTGPNNPVPVGVDATQNGVIDFVCPPVISDNGEAVNIFLTLDGASLRSVVQRENGTTDVYTCASTAEPETAAVRVIHLSPSTPGVDVFANGEGPVVENLEFTSAAGPLDVPAGTYTFDVSPTGTGLVGAALTIEDLELDEGDAVVAAAFDGADGLGALALFDNPVAPAPGQIRLRAAHTANGVGTVDLYAVTSNGNLPLFTDLAFGTAGDAVEVAAGAYTVGFDVNADTLIDLQCEVPALPAGTDANVFAVTGDDGAVFLVALLSGDTTVSIGCDAVTTPDPAALRVVHLSPDAPPVDVFANGDGVVAGLGYPTAAGPLSVPAGSYDVAISPAGAGIGAAVLTVPGLALSEGQAVTAVAFDSLAELKVLPIVDELAPVTAGSIRLRPVHTAVGVGTVDAYAVLDGTDDLPLATGLQFGAVADSVTVPAGGYTVGLDADGDQDYEFLCDVPALPAGTDVLVFATTDDDGTFSLLALFAGSDATASIPCTPEGPQDAAVRVLHLSPNAPAVDVFANEDGPVVSALPFLLGTDALSVPAGSYTFDVAATGSPASQAVLTVPDVPLAEGSSYTVVAYDTVESLKAVLLEDTIGSVPSNVMRVRAVHAAVGVGNVDIVAVSTDGNTSLWTNVPFGGVGNTIDLPPAAYRVGLDVDGDGAPNLVASLPALPGGTYANVVAVTDTAGAASLVVQVDGSETYNVPLLPFDDGGDALVRATFIGVLPGSVDISATGPEDFAVTDVAEDELTQWFSVPAGTYSATAAGGFFNAYTATGTAELEAGKVYTLVVYTSSGNIFGAGIALALLEDDYSALPGRESRVRTAHLDRTVGEVDVIQTSPIPQTLAQNVTVSAIGGWFPTTAGTLTIEADANNDGAGDITWSFSEIPPGRAVNTLVTEGDNDESELILFTRIGLVDLNPQ